jgi:hypothetical protein
LNTLQKYGVHGWWDKTLHGSCENGMALMRCHRLASALPADANPATAMTKQIAMRGSMRFASSEVELEEV